MVYASFKEAPRGKISHSLFGLWEEVKNIAAIYVIFIKAHHMSDIRNLKPTFVGVKKKVTFIIKTF